jgi:hypothetical protein
MLNPGHPCSGLPAAKQSVALMQLLLRPNCGLGVVSHCGTDTANAGGHTTGVVPLCCAGVLLLSLLLRGRGRGTKGPHSLALSAHAP